MNDPFTEVARPTEPSPYFIGSFAGAAGDDGEILLRGTLDPDAIARLSEHVSRFLAEHIRFLTIDCHAVHSYPPELVDLLAKTQRQLGLRRGMVHVHGLTLKHVHGMTSAGPTTEIAIRTAANLVSPPGPGPAARGSDQQPANSDALAATSFRPGRHARVCPATVIDAVSGTREAASRMCTDMSSRDLPAPPQDSCSRT